MKRRKLDPETKTAVVLEKLKGERAVADICRKYQISESLYYRWRDKFLEAGSRALASRKALVRRLLGRPRLRTGTHYWQTGLHPALGYKSPQEYERLCRETNLEKAA